MVIKIPANRFFKRRRMMRKLIALIAFLGLMGNGCAWLGFGDDSETTAQTTQTEVTEPQAVEPEPAPAQKPEAKTSAKKAAAKKSAPAKKGAKTEAQIKAELDKMGHKLAAQSSRTLLPNIKNKEVKKVGSEWVASYISVDPNHVSTELRPGSKGQYVGFIRYQERIMECRGATKEAALAAPCKQVRTRNLNELIRYDGTAWQD